MDAGAWDEVVSLRSIRLAINGSGPTVAGVERARVAAERALALGGNRPEGHIAMAQYLRDIKLDYEGSRAEYQAALKADPNQVDALVGVATVDRILGRFDDALTHAEQAFKVDPRSVATARRVAVALHDLRRFPEELAAWDRALALAPTNLSLIQGKSFAYLCLGQLDSVHALVVEKLKTVDTSALLVRYSLYQETMWTLPPELWPKILKLTPKDFDNDRGHWALKLGHTYKLLGDTAHARMFGDSARAAFEAQLRDFPDRAQIRELQERVQHLHNQNQQVVNRAGRAQYDGALRAARCHGKLEKVFSQVVRESRFRGLIEEHATELLARAQHLSPAVSAPTRIVGSQVEEFERTRQSRLESIRPSLFMRA